MTQIKIVNTIFNKFEKLNFDKKMKVFLGIVIGIVTAICMILSGSYFVRTVKDNSQALAQGEITTMANTLENSLESYKAITWAIMLDANVKGYLHKGELSQRKYVEVTNQAKNTINSILNLQSNINFIGIVPKYGNSYIYRSAAIGVVASKFDKVYMEDFESSMYAGRGTLRTNFSSTYFKGDKYSLNIYIPLYDTERMINELGLLCMSVNDGVLNQIMDREDKKLKSDIYLVTKDKAIIAGSNELMELEKDLDLKGSSGTYQTINRLYSYQKIGDWNYYIVMAIPKAELYRDSYRIIFAAGLLIIIFAVIAFFVSNRLVYKEYEPLNKVIEKMDSVSTGDLKTRIPEEPMGEDFRKLARGFNDMMDRIEQLMNHVAKEQHQMDQIKFNALQSQIQPHFLYNALDCIHWQAVAEGDRETSNLIKALANYYRICLSGGRDIIELSRELWHIENYMIIQNLRYDDIIESDIEVEEKYHSVMIPKLTLQPLIENCIYHGIKVKEGKKGTVKIRVTDRDGDVYILLQDDGTGMSSEEIEEINQNLSKYEDAFGYGVRNVNRRIELLYGEGYGLYYEGNESDGLSVWIKMPLHSEILYKGVL